MPERAGLPGWPAKILTAEQLSTRFARPRRERLVFTNGCFDILHRGHVEYLTTARSLGDLLVVGLNSDASVRLLKGAGRPLNREEDRAALLAALEMVDFVTVFTEPTPLALIERLLPDVLVKGGDYRVEDVVGATAVRAAGGEVVIAPFVPGQSSTEIMNRLRGAPG